VTKKEFFALVKRHNAGDADATVQLRTYADDPRMRREAVRRATPVSGVRVPQRPRRRASSAPAGSLRISRSALRKVIEILGITREVTILWVAADDIPGANGDHRFTQDEHLIRLRNDQAAAGTNRTLLHELAHAATTGDYGSPRNWKRAYNADPERFEAEAAEIAHVLGHLKLVT
jgi:hypothetical protein